MQKYISFRLVASLGISALLTLVVPRSVYAQATDPTGTWTWTTPVPPQDQTRTTSAHIPGLQRKTTLTLKLDGDKLSGTIYTQLSQPRTNPVPITAATLHGERLSFSVTRELNGKKFVQQFAGTITGDTIKGKIEYELNGQPHSAPWTAKREPQGSTEEPKGRTKGMVPGRNSAGHWQMPAAPRSTNASAITTPATSTNRNQ